MYRERTSALPKNASTTRKAFDVPYQNKMDCSAVLPQSGRTASEQLGKSNVARAALEPNLVPRATFHMHMLCFSSVYSR